MMAQMETDDEQLQSTDLEIDKYEALVNGLFRKCEKWLEGKVPGDRLVVMFNRVKKKNFVVSELNGKPEDYDWNRVQKEIFDRADLIDAKDINLMMHVAERTIQTLQKMGKNTTLARAYHFGMCCRDCHYEPEL